MVHFNICKFKIHSTSSEIFPCSYTISFTNYIKVFLHAYKLKLVNRRLYYELNIDNVEGLEVLYGVIDFYLGCNFIVDSLNTNGLLISQLSVCDFLKLKCKDSIFFRNRRSVINNSEMLSDFATGLAYAVKYETMPHSDLDFCSKRIVFTIIPLSEVNSGRFNQSLIYAVNNNLPILYIVLKNLEETYIGPYYMQECYTRYTFVHTCQVHQEDIFSLMYAFELVIKVVKRKGPVILQVNCRYKQLSNKWNFYEDVVDKMEKTFMYKSMYHLLIDPKEKVEEEVKDGFNFFLANK